MPAVVAPMEPAFGFSRTAAAVPDSPSSSATRSIAGPGTVATVTTEQLSGTTGMLIVTTFPPSGATPPKTGQLWPRGNY